MTLNSAHPLRKWRIDNEITLQMLAAELGLTKFFLSQIENGRRQPSVPTARALSRFTGIPMYEFEPNKKHWRSL